MKRQVFYGTALAVGSVWLVGGVFFARTALEWISARVEVAYAQTIVTLLPVRIETKIIRQDSFSLDEIIEQVAIKHQLPEVLLRAVIDQESGGGNALYRFEPDVYTRLKPRKASSDSEVRMLASSHGVAHVMGFNAEPRCGIHWSKLYDRTIGLDCAARILSQNLERHKANGDVARQLWLAVRDYNGAGRAAEAYATTVLARVGTMTLAASLVQSSKASTTTTSG